ncbi:interleukin-1 alpha isoform X2 [Macrotis lagotis]
MARVPDLFEMLHSNLSENERFISDIDEVSLSQESFYPSSSPHHMENWSRFEISKKSQLTFHESKATQFVQRKTEKNHPIANDYLSNTASIPEEDEDLIQCMTATVTFQNRMEYMFNSFLTNQKLTDQNARGLKRSENHLKALHIQGPNSEEVFDIGKYITLSSAPNNRMAVTLKISNTDLYVTAKEENQPVQLEKIPQTPAKIDPSQSPILFYWTKSQNYSTFSSVAHPELFLATHSKDDQLVFMATGDPALINFLVTDADS